MATTANYGWAKHAATDTTGVRTDFNSILDAIDASLAAGDAAGRPRAGMSNITATRYLGILNHTGAPVAADGTFAVGDVVFDSAAQEWVCSVAGSPGTWLAVGSGKALGSANLSSNFTMTNAATVEDVPGMSVTFTYDGRPVRFVLTPVLTSQDQITSKLITLTICRSTDNAVQRTSIRQTQADAAPVINPQSMDTGPLTAWPSDSAAFVVGTAYTIKLRINAGSSAKATILGASTPCTLYVITA